MKCNSFIEKFVPHTSYILLQNQKLQSPGTINQHQEYFMENTAQHNLKRE